MSKVDFFSNDKILAYAEADEAKKKGKKGDGINSILGLIQELRNFMEKVDAAAEAQDIAENKSAVEAINNSLRENSKKLLDIVAGGLTSEVQAIRSKEEVMDVEPMKVEKKDDITLAPEAPVTPKSPYLSGLN